MSLISVLQCVPSFKSSCSTELNDINSQSKFVFANVSPVLYEIVVLQSTEQCSVTLGMLQKHFEIARHVRELVIRPHAKYHNHFNPFDNPTVSSIVRQVAGARVADAMCLDALVKFQWDAEEMPFFQDMWFALRLGCVSTTTLTFIPYHLINAPQPDPGVPNCVI